MGILEALSRLVSDALTYANNAPSGDFCYEHGTLHIVEQHLLLMYLEHGWSRFKVYNEKDVQYWKEQYVEIQQQRGE